MVMGDEANLTRFSPMSNRDRDLVRGWIEFSLLEGEERLSDPRFRYWDELQTLCRSSPARAVSIIMAIAEHDLSEKSLALFAAGPIEEVINCHEDVFWRYAKDKNITNTLKQALRYVWRHGVPEKSRSEISKLI
jgi:hypothetical protein